MGVDGRWGPEGFRGTSVALSDLLVSLQCVVSGLGLVWLLFIGYRQGGSLRRSGVRDAGGADRLRGMRLGDLVSA
jgi:hypothetical protein